MKRILFLLIIFLLFGCSAETDQPYDWQPNQCCWADETTPEGIDVQWLGPHISLSIIDEAYLYTKQCMDVDYPAPVIVFTDGRPQGKYEGFYFENWQFIAINSNLNEYYISELLKHEFVHYFLDMKYGDLDSNHNGPYSEYFGCSLIPY